MEPDTRHFEASRLRSKGRLEKKCEPDATFGISAILQNEIPGVDCNGDDIRRVAGTVGTVSPLFKIKDSCIAHPFSDLHVVSKLES